MDWPEGRQIYARTGPLTPPHKGEGNREAPRPDFNHLLCANLNHHVSEGANLVPLPLVGRG